MILSANFPTSRSPRKTPLLLSSPSLHAFWIPPEQMTVVCSLWLLYPLPPTIVGFLGFSPLFLPFTMGGLPAKYGTADGAASVRVCLSVGFQRSCASYVDQIRGPFFLFFSFPL
ncbi:hypothetical protein BO94DRAFT_69843 [Aspergillus sclerotioniger CBS 115572]|uniref:Uncharacterized protein n=1 Tax=Aspergillus sclerotioniger CBS 115572 TaxID=1450535 RepID=A0A317WPZ3_9EURO|nr:hypothetical protein BO94DRAFT_69843 [Aspergillus sclerotioniger CBS 115572]PWY87197.1 hypothetical protein BO94DRAFT_69843 [Aspergillus sclerotioniger CBS 115572]